MLGFLLRLIPGFGTIMAISHFIVGVVYPTLESFKAIESRGSADDTQWLSYWVVYAVYSLIEKFLWIVLAWVWPLYSLAKLALLTWLVAPQTRGAAFVYSQYTRPFLLVAIDKARTIPQLEPYVRGFGGSSSPIVQVVKKVDVGIKEAVPAAQEAVAEVVGGGDEDAYAPTKAHAQ